MRALDGVEAVFHQAAEVGVGQSMYEITRYVNANTAGTAVLMQALIERRDQVRRPVVAPSMSIYGEGAYRCDEHGEVNPGVRRYERLTQRKLEVPCPVVGRDLQPLPTRESK